MDHFVRGFAPTRFSLTAAMIAITGLTSLLRPTPAAAHHGKDFLLTATDDMPLRGHVYALLSVDDTIETDSGHRSIEITPGVLFAVTNRFSLEPHVHIARDEEGSHYRYGATAVEARYAIGYVGRSQWRWAGSLEYENPRDEHDNLEARLILVRNFARSLVALNLVADRDIEAGGRTPFSVIAGVLRPLNATNNLGLEISAPFPLADGVEVLPGLYHVFGGPTGRTSLKIGIGVFVSRDSTAGTFHTAFIQRF
jgi:hypothetical protein